jgi:hypothetical protein
LRFKNILNTKPEATLLLGGLGLILTSQWLVGSLMEQIRWKAYPLLGLGFILFMLGAHSLYQDKLPSIVNRLLEKSSVKLEVYPNQVVFLFLSLCLAITAVLAAGDGVFMWNMPLSASAWIVGIILSILGSWHMDEGFPKISKKTLLVAALFFLVGFVLRGVSTGTIPPVLNGDEASMGLSAVHFIKGQVNNIFSVGWFSFPSFFYFLQSISIRILGQTTAALRIPSAIIGGLTLSAVYLIGRRMFNPQTGLIAALFMTGFHYHIHFSRMGINNIWDAFWFIVILGMFWDGWKHKRRSSFIIVGVCLGVSQYFYVTVRMLPFILLLWLASVAIFNRDSLRGIGKNLIFVLFLMVIAFLPLAWFFYTHPYDFMAPYARVGVFGWWLENEMGLTGLPAWQVMFKQFVLSLESFISAPLEVWYSPGTAILRPTAAAFFLLGLCLLLLKWRDARTHLFVIWLAAFVATATLSLPATAAQRFVAAAPVCVLLVGYAFSEISRLLAKAWIDKAKILNALGIVVILLIAADDTWFYFKEYTPTSYMGGPNTYVAQKLAEYLQTKEDMDVAFFGEPRMGYYSISSLPYLAPHIRGFDHRYPWGSPDNPKLTNDHVLYVLLPNHHVSLIAIVDTYPQGILQEEYDPYGGLLYWYYEVGN